MIEDVVHASTIASNTVLEGRGARTALITTEGFRDVLELRRLRSRCSMRLSGSAVPS
jgi:N-methylhydantoinase A